MGDGHAAVGRAGGRFGPEYADVVQISRGGSGTVFRARHARLNRTVVIKALDAIGTDGTSSAVEEARTQASVCWHSNVLTVLGEGTTDSGWPYLVLEDAEGGSLDEVVRECGPLRADRAVEVARQLAGALLAARSESVIHCDVKPSNVLLARDGSVRLSDFGASVRSASHTIDPLQGSLPFAPPELLEGRSPGPSNDVYGLGATLCFGLTGRAPFGDADQPASTTIARIHTETPCLGTVDAPSWFTELTGRCMAKDPSARPTIRQVCAELDRANSSRSEDDQPAVTDVSATAHQVIGARRAVVERLYATLGEQRGAVALVRGLFAALRGSGSRRSPRSSGWPPMSTHLCSSSCCPTSMMCTRPCRRSGWRRTTPA